MDQDKAIFLSPRLVAERWGCSVRHVQKKIADESLPVLHLGPKLVRVPLAALEAYEASLMSHAPADR